MKVQYLSLALSVCMLCSGCATLKDKILTVPGALSLSKEKAETEESETPAEIAYGKPAKMLAIWKDSVRTELGSPKMRGFGGRIFLYDTDGNPIRAKGELVVYGFDDSVKERTGSKADKKVVLSNEKFQTRYSKSALGDSYSVWIDWDQPGSPDKSVTLIPFFKTEEGEIIQAGQAIYTLASPKPNQIDREVIQSNFAAQRNDMLSKVRQAQFVDNGKQEYEAQHASYQDGHSVPVSSSKSVKTTTIHVPNATQERLRNASMFVSGRPAKQTGTAVQQEATKSSSSDWIEEARKKRREEMDGSRVFGRPGKP